MEDENKEKQFIAWNFMSKAENPDSEESRLDKGKEEICYEKFEHTVMLCMEKSCTGDFPSGSSGADVPIELPLFVDQCTRELDHATNMQYCLEKKISPWDPMSTDMNADVSTELSLSIGNMSTKTTTTDETKQVIQYTPLCMEKSSGASSSGQTETDTDVDISLKLSRWDHKPTDGLTSGKKRQTKEENREPSTTSKKQSKETMRMTELRPGNGHGHADVHDPWNIKKKLTSSDLGHMSRLLLPSKSVESHILPHWNADQAAKINQGLQVPFLDCDTKTQHDEMQFKRWNNGAYVLIKNWTAVVEERHLEKNDEIGLYWDIHNSRFNFSVLSRAPTA